jgi:hypothetical protein
MLLDISVNLLLGDLPFSDPKGGLFVAFHQSFLLFHYHSFHLIRLNVLVKTPFLNSILILFWADIKSVADM